MTTGTTVFAAILTLLAIVVFALCVAKFAKPADTALSKSGTPKCTIVGSGLTAAACVHNLTPLLKSTVQIREASIRLGGQILSGQQAILPMSTVAQMFEMGAWEYDTFAHRQTTHFLQALQVPIVPQVFMPSQSFTYINKIKGTWPSPPNFRANLQNTTAYKSLDAPTALAWYAYTAIPSSEAGDASLSSVAASALPRNGEVPAGMGWADVVLRGMGRVAVLYNEQLTGIDVLKQGDRSTLSLTYNSGFSETTDVLILTCPVFQANSKISGFLPSVSALIDASFVSCTQSVMYATWSSSNVWWPALGFVSAIACTDLHIGCVRTAGPGVLRCKVAGKDSYQFWNNLIVNEGLAAAKQALTDQLQQAFGLDTAPPLPLTISFRGWPESSCFWKAGVDTTAARSVLSRPCGVDVPVVWACTNLSTAQNCVEGAVESGMFAATFLNDSSANRY
jgi:monoamine oxidase